MSEINIKELYLNFDEYIRQGEPVRDLLHTRNSIGNIY